MSVYVVRLPRDGDAPASMVGIYAASSIEALEAQIKNVCAAKLCEYAAVPHGSMYGVWSQGSDFSAHAESGAPASSDQLSEDWRELFVGAAAPQWQTFRQAAWCSPAERRDALATARRALAFA